jgi:hypothetical protein
MLNSSLIRNITLVLSAATALGCSLAWAVDGVTLIDQNRAIAGNVTPGDTPGFPVTINLPGIYKLASNLVVPNENTTAIFINVDNVTIDLNGFAILGPNVCASDGVNVAAPCTLAGSGWGIDGYTSGGSTRVNTRVMNGTINGMGAYGVVLGRNSRVEKMDITSNGADGIYSLGGIISDTLLRANGGSGITTSGAIITNSRAIFNRGYGINTGTFSIISGNVIATNLSYALIISSNTRYTDNVIENNNGGGTQISGGTQAGVNTCNSAPCP